MPVSLVIARDCANGNDIFWNDMTIDISWGFLNIFFIIYIKDILISSKTQEEDDGLVSQFYNDYENMASI